MFDYDASDALAPQSHFEYVAQAAGIKTPQGNLSERVKKQALEWMTQLEGWCSDLKATTLIDLVLKTKPEIIVEIGVWGGKSLVPMACALKANGKGTIFGIDPWSSFASTDEVKEEANHNFWARADHEWIMRGLMNSIKQFDLSNQVLLIRNSSENAPIISDIDILHIDGNHSEKASYMDVTKWVPLVKTGGWIIFDDITWAENGVCTTAKAVKWLDENCRKIAEFKDMYCVWGMWVKQ